MNIRTGDQVQFSILHSKQGETRHNGHKQRHLHQMMRKRRPFTQSGTGSTNYKWFYMVPKVQRVQQSIAHKR